MVLCLRPHRSVVTTSDIDWLKDRHDWVGLKTIVAITSIREIKSSHNISQETRYFISSIDAKNIEQIAGAIRSHWSVENKLHWSLDVSFNEDDNRTRTGNSAENLSIVRHTAVNMLKKDDSKVGIKTKRMKAGWDENLCLNLLENFNAIALNLIDSSNINPKRWISLALDITKNYSDYDGFVILHGTDTLAYTASVLSFMLGEICKPVIVTGSQIPISEIRSDAITNIMNSLIFACSDHMLSLCISIISCVEVTVTLKYQLLI